MNAPARIFTDAPAVREAVPLLFGLVGPSGSGKTYSALRLATGMQRICGGEIFGVDTESNRMKHYADTFKFRHVPFGAPFSPLDYLAAIEHCVAKGARIVIVDSMSHEHEGPGGVLEWHEAEVERLSRGDPGKAERVKMLAWQKPKAARRRLINTLLQLNVNLIFCFRAKEKIKIIPGKEPEQLGFMPIAGEEFVYEMTAKALLLPGSGGIPTWQPQHVGERAMVKVPEQFKALFSGAAQRPLDEALGEQMAKWAAGAKPSGTAPTEAPDDFSGLVSDLIAKYAICAADKYDDLEAERGAMWKSIRKEQQQSLKQASENARQRLLG